METKATIIRKYAEATPETKVDIICKYYPQIDGIINARIAAMKYIIWEEKEKKRIEESIMASWVLEFNLEMVTVIQPATKHLFVQIWKVQSESAIFREIF